MTDVSDSGCRPACVRELRKRPWLGPGASAPSPTGADAPRGRLAGNRDGRCLRGGSPQYAGRGASPSRQDPRAIPLPGGPELRIGSRCPPAARGLAIRSAASRSLHPSIRCSTITTATIIGGTDRLPAPSNRSANISSGNKAKALPVQDPVNRVRRHPALTVGRRRAEQVSLPRRQAHVTGHPRKKSRHYGNSPEMITRPGGPPRGKTPAT